MKTLIYLKKKKDGGKKKQPPQNPSPTITLCINFVVGKVTEMKKTN